jgi:hypothetical protein
MCQLFGTYVTTVCRLPHAKAITGQIMLYLENFNKAAKCVQNRGPVLGGVMPLRVPPACPESCSAFSALDWRLERWGLGRCGHIDFVNTFSLENSW